MPGLELERHARDVAEIVTIKGDLDVYTAGQLRELTLSLALSRLVVDLTDCTFLDATGLGIIVGALKRCRAADGGLAVVAPAASRIRKVFERTGLTKVLPLRETLGEALAALEERVHAEGSADRHA